jgi:hypothetical protein
MRRSYDAEAKRMGFDLRRVTVQIVSRSLRLGSYPRRSHRVSAGAHCPSDCQPCWQFAGPGIAEVTLRRASPAGLIRHKADFTTFTAGAPGGNAKELAAN